MTQRWQFFRAGAVDQVSLRDGADLLALPKLDQKLWVALAMPTMLLVACASCPTAIAPSEPTSPPAEMLEPPPSLSFVTRIETILSRPPAKQTKSSNGSAPGRPGSAPQP